MCINEGLHKRSPKVNIFCKECRICRLRANCKSADMSKYKVKLHFYAVNACICTDETLFLLFQVKYVFLYIFTASSNKHRNLYINLACLGAVCLFVSNKRQNDWSDRAQFFCGTSRDPREGLWMIKFSKICLHQNSIFENFENPLNFFFIIC